jgi:hypothetical protein
LQAGKRTAILWSDQLTKNANLSFGQVKQAQQKSATLLIERGLSPQRVGGINHQSRM